MENIVKQIVYLNLYYKRPPCREKRSGESSNSFFPLHKEIDIYGAVISVHSKALTDDGLKPGFRDNSGNFVTNLRSAQYFLHYFSKYLLKPWLSKIFSLIGITRSQSSSHTNLLARSCL